jgi:hypothetical protein
MVGNQRLSFLQQGQSTNSYQLALKFKFPQIPHLIDGLIEFPKEKIHFALIQSNLPDKK